MALGSRPRLNLGTGKRGSGSGNPFAAAKRDFEKVLRDTAAKELDAAVVREIMGVEKQSLNAKPLHVFSLGSPKSNRNLIKAVQINFDHRPEILTTAMNTLFEKGAIPVDSGEYRREFKLLINGEYTSVASLSWDDEAAIVNITPYARKLEVGKRADGRPFVVQVAPHMVERIATEIMQEKWGRLTRIDFNYRDIPDPYILQNDSPNKKGKVRKGKRAGDAIRYPAIILGGLHRGLRRR